MDRNELLKYLICEIDLVMHDKDYRFENEDGTWYSRESCKNLTNEEVFEELKGELRQLAQIEDDFADLEAKLAESEKSNEINIKERDKICVDMSADYNKQIIDLKVKLEEAQKTIEIQRMSSNALMEENLEYRWDITDTAYEYAKNIAKGWESQYQEEIDQLKQQLAEKDEELNRYAELFGMKDKDFYVVEKNEYDKMVSGAKQFARETAIAELEKVKKLLDDCYGYEYTSLYHFIQSKAEEKIDQQIKELKGENENV